MKRTVLVAASLIGLSLVSTGAMAAEPKFGPTGQLPNQEGAVPRAKADPATADKTKDEAKSNITPGVTQQLPNQSGYVAKPDSQPSTADVTPDGPRRPGVTGQIPGQEGYVPAPRKM